MIGSCRGVPHLNHLNQWNMENGYPFLIYYIDPFDFNWDKDNNRVDGDAALAAAEWNPRILDIFERTTIFIHEHFSRYGMFNTDPSAETNIYGFGMAPKIDLCLPNFHDRFIMFKNILEFDKGLADQVRADGSIPTKAAGQLRAIGRDSIQAFLEMCAYTSFPEFAAHFRDNMRRHRMWWNHNHITVNFTVPLFRMVCERLGIHPSEEFFRNLYNVDIFDSGERAPLTQPDIEAHGWAWREEIQTLKP